MLRSVARSPFWSAASKFWIVERTMSSCDTFGSESRVSSTVPSIATAASAAITSTSATTQPQLRLRLGRLRGVAARRNQLRRNGFRERCRLRRSNDLGGRLGRGVDLLRRPRVEAGGRGEPALPGCVGHCRFRCSGSRRRHDLGGRFVLGSAAITSVAALVLGRRLVRSVGVGGSSAGFGHLFGGLVRWSGPDGFDIPAAVLP